MKMITHISLKYKHNKRYLADLTIPSYGEKDISDLRHHLVGIAAEQDIAYEIVCEIDDRMKQSLEINIQEICLKHSGYAAHVTTKTKRKRSYSLYGLTIHEEDIDDLNEVTGFDVN